MAPALGRLIDRYGPRAILLWCGIAFPASSHHTRPACIIQTLGLRKPIYTATAAYGHFGRKPERRIPLAGGEEEVQFFPWEQLDRVDDLRSAIG